MKQRQAQRLLMLCIVTTQLLLLLTVVVAGATSSRTFSAPVQVLPDKYGVTSLTLTVKAARIIIDGAVNFTTRAYYYKGVAMYPGPTIVVQPGGILNLTLVNALGSSAAIDNARMMNQWRNANVTNIHTHGLHVSPVEDSVFVRVNPGETFVYKTHVPSTHAPGTHWYHAHTHGSSTLQIMGGLVGGLVVQPKVNTTLKDFTGMAQEHVLVVTRLQFIEEKVAGSLTQDCGQERPNFVPFKQYSYAELNSGINSSLPLNPQFADGGAAKNFMLVNGQMNPTLTIKSGERRLFQIVYAAGENPLEEIL